MTDYADSSNVKCSGCGVIVNTADPSCDCQREEATDHECPKCGDKFDKELFPTLRACYDHEEDAETLREIANGLEEYINLQKKAHNKETKSLEDQIKTLEDQIKTLEAQLRGMI